ncbi:MAG: transcriptional repressor NrdR, partial [Chloroflexi bacterium]|nr:transcriptional repressor NrdR [Chloroflexota bacterium]
MRCPYCQHVGSRVLDTTHDNHGGIRRRRECDECHQRFSTLERPILATPLLVKRDGTREEFDREKLTRGIRISCAKRPVPAAEIDRLVGEIESSLQQMGRAEVSSRIVGDMVMAGLKKLDQIAYVRYA